MVVSTSFHNSSVILWRSVLLVEETTDMSQVTDRLYHIMLYQVHIHLAMSEIQNHNFSFSIKLPSGNSNTQIIADRNWQCRRTNHKLEVKSHLFYTTVFLLSQRWPLITSLTEAVKIANLALNDNHSLTPIRYMYLQFYSCLLDTEVKASNPQFSVGSSQAFGEGYRHSYGKANVRDF